MLCLDEMGPVSAKSYPGRQLCPTAPPCTRAKQPTDYGKRGGGFAFGAFAPATGAAFVATYARRNATNWVEFLEAVDAWVAPQIAQVVAILDNLGAHRGQDAQLFSLGHARWRFVFVPKGAAYLNLIEPWWKTLRSLGLKGKRFETWEEVAGALQEATAYWNGHKHPYVWGRRRRHRRCRHQPYGIARIPRA